MNKTTKVALGLTVAFGLAAPSAEAHAPARGKPSHHKGVKPRNFNTSSRTHLHVNCQEDEVAAPRKWRPGESKVGLNWECVNGEDFVRTFHRR